MILTGKCLEDFTKWNNEREHDIMLPFEYPIYLNALIIEFFDSVGIYIEISIDQITDKHKDLPNCFFIGAIFHVKHRTKEGRTLTYGVQRKCRQEATTQVIIKANEIYNAGSL